jgi:hypothetical protein
MLWWAGHKWLRNGKPPTFRGLDFNVEDVTREQKIEKFFAHFQLDTSLLDIYSSLLRLQKVTAWCRRFIMNCRVAHQDWAKGYLTVEKLVAERVPFCPVVRLISGKAGTAGWSTPPMPLAVCFAGSFAVSEDGFLRLREEMVPRRDFGWYSWAQTGYTLIWLKRCFCRQLVYITNLFVIRYLEPKERKVTQSFVTTVRKHPRSPPERWPKCRPCRPLGRVVNPHFHYCLTLSGVNAIRLNTPQGSYVRRWLVSKSELMGWSSPSDFSQATFSRNALRILRNVVEWPMSCDVPMHCHAELCGPSSHNTTKRTISKRKIGLNTLNN